MPKRKFTALRDSAEKDGHGYVFEPSNFCLGTTRVSLATGDYSMAGYYEQKIVVVERKGTAAELAANLTGRTRWPLFRAELERLEEFRWPYLVLEFSLAELYRFPHGSSIPRSRQRSMRVRGPCLLRLLLNLQMQYRTQVVFAGDAAHARTFVTSLFKRVCEQVAL